MTKLKAFYIKIWPPDIYREFSIAAICYLVPFATLLLHFLTWFIPGYSEIHFLVIAALVLLPTSIAGLVFSTFGLKIAKKSASIKNKDIGIASVCAGIFFGAFGMVFWVVFLLI